MKLIVSVVAVLALGAGALFVWKRPLPGTAQAREDDKEATALVETRDILFSVTAAGEIGPADQVSVRPEVNGRIAELPVDIGDKVRKGALLCRLDDQDLQIERSSRLTDIDGAKLQLQKASRSFTRAKQLFEDKLIAQEVFEDARTEYDLATNALDRAEKALRLIEDRLTKTKILAPFDCTVLTRPVSVGQTVSGAAGFNSGTEIATIANLNEMIINAHINQADVIRLQPGQQVRVQVESVPGLELTGVVQRIAPQAVIRNGIKGFSARILLKDVDPAIRPGMTAVLNIPIATAQNVLAVPLSAVFTENGDRFVYVKTPDGFERRPVAIGLSDYSFAEVQRGLTAGEIVALEQPDNATAVRPEEKSGATPARAGGGSPRTAADGSRTALGAATSGANAPAALRPQSKSAGS
ncbi:MAG TPA: efflux RND transporter periplasmic adaptor subunit [Methylomirabilota bacterium]|nr:efflux RND transporter periplasmic adaptor subunit [Methylomirabilota bacterium]